MPHLFDVCREL